MAQEGQGQREQQERHSEHVQLDEFSTQLVPDPANPNVRALKGFLLGRSDREDYWRLYLNADLTHYFEFRRRDTVHAREMRPGQTIVWVRPDSRIEETSSRSISLDFLQGEIRRGFLRGVSGMNSVFLTMAEGCPCSGCAHCTQSCSQLPGGDTADLSCGC